MSIEYDSVIAAVAGFLGNYTDLTVKADPFGKMKEFTTPVVAVSIEEAESTASGVGDYLGIFSDAETGVREIYGRYLRSLWDVIFTLPIMRTLALLPARRCSGRLFPRFPRALFPLR